jgi:hypothetical protein
MEATVDPPSPGSRLDADHPENEVLIPCRLTLFEQLAHQSQGRLGVAPALNKHVEDLAFVVNGTPEVHLLAGDPDHHFVQVPSVARATAAPSKPSRDHRSKLQHPASDGLIGYVEPAVREEILDVSIAEHERQVESDRMLDDDWGKAVAAV